MPNQWSSQVDYLAMCLESLRADALFANNSAKVLALRFDKGRTGRVIAQHGFTIVTDCGNIDKDELVTWPMAKLRQQLFFVTEFEFSSIREQERMGALDKANQVRLELLALGRVASMGFIQANGVAYLRAQGLNEEQIANFLLTFDPVELPPSVPLVRPDPEPPKRRRFITKLPKNMG